MAAEVNNVNISGATNECMRGLSHGILNNARP